MPPRVDHLKSWLRRSPTLSDDPTHPAQVVLRTYALSLSLSLGPSLVSIILSLIKGQPSRASALGRVLRRELSYDGFAFAITLAVGGGTTIRHFWQVLEEWQSSDSKPKTSIPFTPNLSATLRKFQTLLRKLDLSMEQKTFLANVLSSSVGVLLLQAGRERATRLRRKPAASSNGASGTSPTMDLTLLLVVRAVDSILQSFILKRTGVLSKITAESQRLAERHAEPDLVQNRLMKEQRRREKGFHRALTSQVDALVFWACSARIMWCFFYEPQRLPHSYVKWIGTLADLDPRLTEALRYIREGTWSYISGSLQHADLLTNYSHELGHPSAWGDPNILPPYGGAVANATWKELGLTGRSGVGGLPCDIVHGRVGSSLNLSNSCTTNVTLRSVTAFLEAIAIYLPAHFIPVLLTRPQSLLRPHRLLETFIGALRSATFLTSFVALYWYTVCFTRTFGLPKLLPFISHDFWDGPYGSAMFGSLMCGSSIWIESGRRRGEMALYVLPRALRTCLPSSWLKNNLRGIRFVERIAFVLSFSSLLTAAIHRPDSLRGLSRWTVAFITNGPNAGFWKRRRRDPSVPPTPSSPATPSELRSGFGYRQT